MFTELRNRLVTAFDFARHGAFHNAAEVLIYGDIEDDLSTRTNTPLIKNTDFWVLLDEIGLGFLKPDFDPGHHVKHDLGNHGMMTLHIDTSDKAPHASLFLSGRTLNAYLAIKQNPETGYYQIDDALIGSKDLQDDDNDENYPLSIDDHDIARGLLIPFLAIFAQTAKIISDDDGTTTPQELEASLIKQLNPIIDRIMAI